jgi:imidazolonepropionase-like amidohydrolase
MAPVSSQNPPAASNGRPDPSPRRTTGDRIRALLRRRPGIGGALARRAQDGIAAVRDRRGAGSGAHPRGVAFAGMVWTGGDADPEPGLVTVDGAGVVRQIVIGGDPSLLPHELLVLGGPTHWVVPGITDAHVHLSFDRASSDEPGPGQRAPTVSGLDTGLVAVRDLGAPLLRAKRWQTGRRPPPPGQPRVAVSGPVLTAPGGYPSRSWGRGGFAEFVRSPSDGRAVVQRLAADGVDLIKVALERGGSGWPVPGPDVLAAIVRAAHDTGLPVVAHALTADLVTRAVDAGVDELVHTPTDRLDPVLIERIAAAGISVVSTLQTFFSGGEGRAAADNAADLLSAGVRLRYGTDLGNAGTRPGVDPRELDRLAAAGLGRLGALRAATQWSAEAPGMRNQNRTGFITNGEAAALVLLPFSPLAEPGVWRTPAAVYTDGRLTVVHSRPTASSQERPAT